MNNEPYRELVNISHSIAAAMGGDWISAVVRDNAGELIRHMMQLRHPKYDYVITLKFADRSDNKQLRFRADGSFFQNKAIHKEGGAIFISKSKTPQTIARELERRLMPELRAYDEDAKANYKENQEYDRRVNANLQRVLDASYGKLRQYDQRHYQGRGNELFYSRSDQQFRIEAKVYSEHVHLNLESLTIERAEAILHMFFDSLEEKQNAARQNSNVS